MKARLLATPQGALQEMRLPVLVGVELALNMTRPDVDFPTVRVTVPGLRHFWARFAPGRLYDAPVPLG